MKGLAREGLPIELHDGRQARLVWVQWFQVYHGVRVATVVADTTDEPNFMLTCLLHSSVIGDRNHRHVAITLFATHHKGDEMLVS